MRDNMLVNLTGLEGHCMPIDLNIEHLIKFLKVGPSHEFVQVPTYIGSFSSLQRGSMPPGIIWAISLPLSIFYRVSASK